MQVAWQLLFVPSRLEGVLLVCLPSSVMVQEAQERGTLRGVTTLVRKLG